MRGGQLGRSLEYPPAIAPSHRFNRAKSELVMMSLGLSESSFPADYDRGNDCGVH